jgi:uncharacterized protein (TIGR03032 family)
MTEPTNPSSATPNELPIGTRAVVDVRCSPSESLAPLLERLGLTVILTAPHSGNLITVSSTQGHLTIQFHTFERVMGVAVDEEVLGVCTRSEVWFVRNIPDVAAKLEPKGRYDACYLTRACHFTGDIHGHEVVWANGELWIVNTLFSCLCTLHDRYSFAPAWQPWFITQLVPEDRCHLNGLAIVEDRPAYVTAIAETDTRNGWRASKGTTGCVIDIASNEAIVRGLCMPHSPRVSQGDLYLLDSGKGELVRIDQIRGRVELVSQLLGFTRGLAIHDSFAFVGLSRIRPTSDMNGLPIANDRDRLKCGLVIVDLNTGQTVAHLEFSSPVDELFDVQLLPGIRNPFLSGPHVDREKGQPLWTIPPRES